jgi:hypothetical protein
MATKERTVAKVGKTSDVAEIITALETKIEALGHLTDSKYKTSGQLEGFGNIKEMTNVSQLVKAFSSVKNKEKFYNEAAEELGLTTYPAYDNSGYTAEDWKHDIQLRIGIINHKDTLDQLTKYRDQLRDLLSKEEKKAILLQDMQGYLKTIQ